MLRISIIIVLMLGSIVAKSQLKINGVVIDAETKYPLSNASILQLNGSSKTQTDQFGRFSIASGSKYVLEISFTGYLSQRITIDRVTTDSLKVLLVPNTTSLQEVIVSTGYQQLPRERATGSFSTISEKQFNEQTGINVLSRLEAAGNGIMPDRTTSGSGGRLMVRGLSTIQGSKDPLIVLDNFPYEGNLDNLNPNDILNITILKDAAAASIWGARAGNGVIIVTTKRGYFNQPLKINLNVNAIVLQKPDLSYLPLINSADFIDVESYLFSQGYYNEKLTALNKPALSPVIELLHQRQGAIAEVKETIDSKIAGLRNVDVRDDFEKYLYKNGVQQQYALNLSGGSERFNWVGFGGVDRSRGNLAEKYNRLNLKLQNSFKPIEGLEVTTSVMYTNTENVNGNPAFGNIQSANNGLYPYAQFADAEGNSLAIIKDYRTSYIKTAGDGKLLNWEYFPLEDIKHRKSTSSVNDLLLNGGLNYKLPFGLSADIRYQFERQQTVSKDLQDIGSYYTRNLINSFSQITNTGAIYKIPRGGILDQNERIINANNIRGQINFEKEISNHRFIALAGAEIRESKTEGSANRLYGYNSEIITFGQVDLTTAYPDFTSGFTSFIPAGQGLTEVVSRFVSIYANGAYTLNEKYTLSLSARRDASNLFGISINDKWTPLWSGGLSWELSKEKFMSQNIFSYLRLRSTYGLSGNLDPTKSGVTTIRYASTLSQYTALPYASFSRYANPELKWETTGMFNLGLDFAIKNNWLTGNIEFFTKKGKDLFGTSPLDYTGGVGSYIVKNVASMRANGWDFQLQSINLSGASFRWSTVLNLSKVKDRVTDYFLRNTQGSNFMGPSNIISGVVGQPVYSLLSYKWGGLEPETGLPRGYLNGEISKTYNQITRGGTQVKDLVFFGSAIPTTYGSLGNTFNYKDLSLSVRLTYKLGYYFRRQSINYPMLYSSWRGHKDFASRWQKPGDENITDIPAFVYPFNNAMQDLYTYSSPLIEKGDHIRLNYINLSYQFNKSKLKNLFAEDIQIYMNITNLGLLWTANKKGLDPDYVEESSIPAGKNLSLGIRINF